MPNYLQIGGLKVHSSLAKLVEEKICPCTGFSPEYFWVSLGKVVQELGPDLEACLKRRDDIQAKIDNFYCERRQAGAGFMDLQYSDAAKSFLREIGYLEPDQGTVSITTQFVDPEISSIPAPQLVVPSDNARYVLNAVNSRWGSLYDALYGFDVIPETAVQSGAGGGAGFAVAGGDSNAKGTSGYNPVRGSAVIDFANGLLDEIAPLTTGRWCEVTRLWPKYVGACLQLEMLLKSGETTSLKTPALFVGFTGTLGPPAGQPLQVAAPRVPDKGRIFLRHNGLHLILEIDRDDRIGKAALSGIKDITMESALTTILDMEDSVSAVDAEDKARIYANINGIFRGTLTAPYVKNGVAMERTMSPDVWLRDTKGEACTLPGRCIALVRNVGHHMFTDAVMTEAGKMIPEGFLDCFITAASALQDLRGTGQRSNSRTGSLYIVKPKMHGPGEVALTSRLFGRVEEVMGLRRNTIKMGIMDEERRTSVNLRECLRVAAERAFFINTGFLDRTGDEIHTCMMAGPVVPKSDMKSQAWIRAYEDSNVDVGLFAGLPGKGQIGKGMWAKPDSMRAMIDAKIAEVMAGASTAWVPSPSAGTLHSIHYHRCDVLARQMQLAMRAPVNVEKMLYLPLLPETPSKEVINHELRENAQSILGYVVRWVDLGVGCSKVPDLSNVGLMEDRATLRISSQLLANWLYHGLINEADVRSTFKDMAKVVDQQNANDRSYVPMCANLDNNIPYQAALKLVLAGREAPNGYTEFTLHEARRKAKANVMARL
eukprot:CAMPEP_0170614778 /NCGR_PEP_ID=MMETSP0224-20130122/24987_1 /TAXON_ID=285029 /ORGANISM="Togula jolla, Strain CCCM 725" /LENGTH=769 /DNA_ID=CAMNT_0010940469 /DNA_START=18 /DNA_END=2327 /DNA_ORIENTATION=+